jgi:hypothetical protein
MGEPQKPASTLPQPIRDLTTPERLAEMQKCLISLTAAIPGYGGNLATILDQWLPDWKFQRLKSFVEELQEDARRHERRLDEQAARLQEQSAQWEDLALMYEHVAKQVAQTPGEHKRKAYRAVLLNALLSPPEGQEQDFFLSWLDRMQEIHVALLAVLAKPCDPDPRVVEWLISQPRDLLKAAYGELVDMGLASTNGQVAAYFQHAEEYFNLYGKLSSLGKRLVDFITLPTETS